MRKRSLRVVMLFLFCLIMAGCGRKETVLNPEDPTAIVIWHYYSGMQKELFDQLVQDFNDTLGAEKGIIVTAESKGEVNALAEAVLDAAQKEVGAEEMPDIFASYMDTANTLNEMGMLVDINQYMTEEELKDYVPAFLEEGRLGENELQVLPVAKATELLYLNKTDWDKFAGETGHDISELATWEGIAAAAEDYYKWSGGKAFFGRDAAANYMFVGCHQLGNEVYQMVDGKMWVSLDESSLKKIWDTYALPYIKGYYGAYGRFRSDDVKTGDLIACVGSTSSVAYFPSEVTLEDGSTYGIESVVLPLPNFEGTKAASVQQGAGMAVTKSSMDRETAAVEFLRWFTSEEQNTFFCADSGYFPVKSGAGLEENMKHALKEHGIEESDLVYENAMLGLQAIHETELYAPPVVENGETYRGVIALCMTDYLEQFRASYTTLEAEAQEVFLEQCYEQWIGVLKRGLSN